MRSLGLGFAVVSILLCPLVRADHLELVRQSRLWDPPALRSADTSGLTYHPPSGRLILVDSEISEYGRAVDAEGVPIFQGVNVFECPLVLDRTFAAHLAEPAPGVAREPVGVVFNPKDGHIYVTDDDRKKIYRYPFDTASKFGAPVAEVSTDIDGQYSDPEGITCDLETGRLFVVSGTRDEKVLIFRFDIETDVFVFDGQFPVGEQIRDPEGIAYDPVSGNLFLIASDAIAEFTQSGDFVQQFDYGFLDGAGSPLTLAGGGTFAPTSDPNDPPDRHSLYIAARGIDNGAFPDRDSLDGSVTEVRVVRDGHNPELGPLIRVPGDVGTIQGAIDRAVDGGVIRVAPGVYRENLVIGPGKAITIASDLYWDGDSSAIAETVIDGGGGDGVAITIEAGADPGVRLIGLTIRNADDGIKPYASFTMTQCWVTDCTDGVDYEGGGGLIDACRFWNNRDDAIDLDLDVAATIQDCEIVDNDDDGIEIRFQPFNAWPLPIVIRHNLIARNGEDGIQLIGYDEPTSRTILIERNVIVDNAMAGLGMMDGANTREDYSAAALPEPVTVVGNTFVRQVYHITGGANLFASNNYFVSAEKYAVLGVNPNTRLGINGFWDNGALFSRTLSMSEVTQDPQLDDQYRPAPGSPAIDAGRLSRTPDSPEATALHRSRFLGDAPDLGAWEWGWPD